MKAGAENSSAVLAAGRAKMGIKEEKRKWRGRVRGVVGGGRRRDDWQQSLSCFYF